MKRKAKTGSGVWQYLEQSGVLEHGSPEEIQAARALYWAEVKKRWKQEKCKVYTITLTKEESKELIAAAKSHHTRPTTFIRSAFFAYIRSSFVAPDPEATREIRLLLARNYLFLQEIAEEEWMQPAATNTLLQQMGSLEQAVLSQLLNPIPFEKYVAQIIREQPGYRQIILDLLQPEKR